MLKTSKRQEVLRELKAHHPSVKKRRDVDLLEQWLSLQSYQKAKCIAVYLSFPFEYDTELLISKALSDGKIIVVPKTYSGGRMIFVPYHPNELQETSFGLREPVCEEEIPKSAIDLILVPGIVFNSEGFRIGFGGGYYDRYLADFKGATVSLIYPFQRGEFVQESHDVSIKEVLCARV